MNKDSCSPVFSWVEKTPTSDIVDIWRKCVENFLNLGEGNGCWSKAKVFNYSDFKVEADVIVRDPQESEYLPFSLKVIEVIFKNPSPGEKKLIDAFCVSMEKMVSNYIHFTQTRFGGNRNFVQLLFKRTEKGFKLPHRVKPGEEENEIKKWRVYLDKVFCEPEEPVSTPPFYKSPVYNLTIQTLNRRGSRESFF